MATTKVDSVLLDTTGTASSSTFLRGDGAWAEPSGGAWTLIGTQVADDSGSTLTQTGLSSTYDTYAIALSDCHPATDSVGAEFRLGDSSGIDSGASDYGWSSFVYQINNTTAGSIGSEDSADDSIVIGTNNVNCNIGNAAGEGMGGMFYLHTPSDGQIYPIIDGRFTVVESGSQINSGRMAGVRWSAIAIDRIQFFFDSGNIVSGRMTVWGLAHA